MLQEKRDKEREKNYWATCAPLLNMFTNKTIKIKMNKMGAYFVSYLI